MDFFELDEKHNFLDLKADDPVLNEVDIIVCNAPFKLKYEFVNQLVSLGKPFSIMLPLQTLTSKKWLETVIDFPHRIGIFNGSYKGFTTPNNSKEVFVGELCVIQGHFSDIIKHEKDWVELTYIHELTV